MARFLVPRRSVVIRRRSTLEASLPPDHVARFLWRVLSEIDFSEVEELYGSTQGRPGRPPYHPRVLVALWVYGMMQGLETAADIARACTIRDDFRWLAGGLNPSDQTLLNLLDHGGPLQAIWSSTLKSMQRVGLIDLSKIFEDGTKLRANASPKSFRTAEEIDARIADIERRIRGALTTATDPPGPKQKAEIRSLTLRLRRAERAATELRERAIRRSTRGSSEESTRPLAPHEAVAHESIDRIPAANNVLPIIQPPTATRPWAQTMFGRTQFKTHPERDVMICPADQELRFIGIYSESGRRAYRLYRRSDCAGCALKAQCTEGRSRQLKIPAAVPEAESVASSSPASTVPGLEPSRSTATSPSDRAKKATPEPGTDGKQKHRGPVASVTEPEALMMLATSEKRWEPSYNADIAATKDGVIVSQFLTKRPTDFHSFAPALVAVIATVGRPQTWIGDGHYGTHSNLLLADREDVLLYASSTNTASNQGGGGSDETADSAVEPNAPNVPPALLAPKRFGRADFLQVVERDVLICPAAQELSFIGIYADGGRPRPSRLYRKADCTGCSQKTMCTTARGRAVKIPIARERDDSVSAPTAALSSGDGESSQEPQDLPALIEARDARMKDQGDEIRRLRGSTIEPINAQLKQHGLGRFHVHGLARCASVLTLACLGHNVMKWKARVDAQKVLNVAA